MSRYNYSRRKSSVAKAGKVEIGGSNPIRIQSMTNTSTLDTEGSVAQALRIAEAGGEIVRLTTQGCARLRICRRYVRDLMPPDLRRAFGG